VTREDIDPGYQIAQSCHAMRQFTEEHPELDSEWFAVSNYVACLSVPTEKDLEDLLRRAQEKGIPASSFKEPDIDNQLTAIALAPGDAARRLCSSCRLALSRR